MVLNKGLLPVFPLGPFPPLEFEGEASFTPLEWLENQRESSVFYVNFGSRTAMSKEQIRELGKGLVLSGYKFLWVVKSKTVDKEETGDDLDEIVGHQVMNNVEDKNGFVVNHLEWAQHGDQMINGEVIEAAGWGVCMKSWGWGLNNHLVKGEEIGDKIKELMESQMLRMEAANKSSEAAQNLMKLFQSLKD
ncbi:UDP-glucosyl transferase 71C3 [Hibiscus trionum]|uniref:UDP-glucosyl transferase 71C3 n=1 Tax=Hibiscus trionum TaxID=183268 RepID=A0A9W7MJT7_HIBTR|nr:UDP-glucosyl transferase 71C3 [Hibiscus trionum]